MVPDVIPKYITELRGDSAVAAIVSTRVRSPEPAEGDARGPGEYQAFVVLRLLESPRVAPRVPVQRPLVLVQCYGVTPQQAAELRWACSAVLHLAGGRTYPNGLHIYQSLEDSGGEQLVDPDTRQPYQEFIVSAHASTVAVA